MAYATAEDRAFFAGLGYRLNERDGQFERLEEKPTRYKCVAAVWKNRKIGDLDAPATEAVFWTATAEHQGAIHRVVTFADGQTSPQSAYVLAEIRQWTTPS